jgi:hypothetical protein
MVTHVNEIALPPCGVGEHRMSDSQDERIVLPPGQLQEFL